jgi:type VI secretion system secreted protein VgrG
MDSPLRRLEVVVVTPQGEVAARALAMREAVSEPTSAQVELSLHQDPGLGGAVDADVDLVWLLSGREVRRQRLRVAAVHFRGVRQGMLRFTLDLRHPFHFLSIGEDTRKFRDLDARAIVDQVLGGAGVDRSWSLARAPWSRPVCIQYRESRLAFVSRLLEFEGMHYVCEDDGGLAISDRSSAAAALFEQPLRLVTARGALTHDVDALLAIERGRRVGSGKVTVNDYDWKRPAASLLASAGDERDAALEVYDFPTGYRREDQGATLARLRLEAHVARKTFFQGETSAPTLRAGRRLAVEHEEGVSYAADTFLLEVTHDFQIAEGDAPPRYQNRFESIPAEVPYRTVPLTPEPRVGGYHTARVVGPPGEEIHTDPFGRCKVSMFWDREADGTDRDSRWLRTLQETSSCIILARVGWEMGVAYVDGSPDRPVAIARLINGTMVPTYAQPGNQNVLTIKTETYPGKQGHNEIKIDDTAGAQRIDVRAQRDALALVKHDQSETIGRDETQQIGTDLTRVVSKTQRLDIGRNDTVRIGATDRWTVTRDREERVGGSEKVKVGTDVTITVGRREREAVGSLRTSIVGGVKPPSLPKLEKPKMPDLKGAMTGALKEGKNPLAAGAASLKSAVPSLDGIKAAAKPPQLDDLIQGQITRSASERMSRTVGAASIALARGAMARDAGKLLVEVTGGLRLASSAKESITRASSKDMVRMIGGALIEKAGTSLTRAADVGVTTIGGNAAFEATKKLELRGETIRVEAQTSLDLVCGGLSIAMTPDTLTITGDLKLKTGSSIQVGGSPDDLTR